MVRMHVFMITVLAGMLMVMGIRLPAMGMRVGMPVRMFMGMLVPVFV
jgi:hypothetical protein